MKTHELAEHIEIIAKILRELPDGELYDTLEHLLWITRKSRTKQGDRSHGGETTPLSQELIKRFAAMSPAQIEEILSTSEEFANSNRVRELAENLGIKMSRRQNHAALVNMIVRHFEARQMDSIIREGRMKDDPSRDSGSN